MNSFSHAVLHRLYLYYIVHILNFLIVLYPTVKMRTMSYCGKPNFSLSQKTNSFYVNSQLNACLFHLHGFENFRVCLVVLFKQQNMYFHNTFSSIHISTTLKQRYQNNITNWAQLKFSCDLLTVHDLKLIKNNDIVVRTTYAHFSLPTTFSSKFDFFVQSMFAQCKDPQSGVHLRNLTYFFCPVLVCQTSFVCGVINYYFFIRKNYNCCFSFFYT